MSETYHNYTKGNVDFEKSETLQNLMRAFAGESQARNRYTFAASFARAKGLPIIAKVFEFTAEQERAHAKVFYDLLKSATGQNITIDGSYPVNIYPDVLGYLKAAQHNEYQEWEHDYPAFSRTAYEEGFEVIGKQFEMISGIERIHGDRFGRFAELLEQDKLFLEEEETAWICLNCGQIIHATAAPGECPVCRHGQGHFVRLDMAPVIF